jgi:hypothetical protein
LIFRFKKQRAVYNKQPVIYKRGGTPLFAFTDVTLIKSKHGIIGDVKWKRADRITTDTDKD